MPFAIIMFMSLMLGVIAMHKNNLYMVQQPSVHAQQVNSDAAEFIAYRDAVTAYMLTNRTFTGSVPNGSLTGNFSTAFLQNVGNVVTATGTAGRVITCYGKLATGTVQAAMIAAGVDASIGITNDGSTWVSAAPDALKTSTPLSASVPAGDIVSVIQIGS